MPYKITPRLKELRESRGLTGKELSALAGVTEATISRFDSQGGYDTNILISLSRALSMSVEDLFLIEEIDG